jgi:hypothetical protein
MSYGNAFLQRDLLEMKAARQSAGLAAWDVTHPTGSLFLWHVKLSGAPGTMLAGAVYDVYVRLASFPVRHCPRAQSFAFVPIDDALTTAHRSAAYKRVASTAQCSH